MLKLILNAKKYRYATKIFILMLVFTLFYISSGTLISYGCTLGFVNNAIELKSMINLLFSVIVISCLMYLAPKNNKKKTI